VLFEDFRRAVFAGESAVVNQLHLLLLRSPFASSEVAETIAFVSDLSALRTTHSQSEAALIYGCVSVGGGGEHPGGGGDLQQNIEDVLAAGRRCEELEHDEIDDEEGQGGDMETLGAGWKVGVVSPPVEKVFRSQKDLLGFIALIRSQVKMRGVRGGRRERGLRANGLVGININRYTLQDRHTHIDVFPPTYTRPHTLLHIATHFATRIARFWRRGCGRRQQQMAWDCVPCLVNHLFGYHFGKCWRMRHLSCPMTEAHTSTPTWKCRRWQKPRRNHCPLTHKSQASLHCPIAPGAFHGRRCSWNARICSWPVRPRTFKSPAPLLRRWICRVGRSQPEVMQSLRQR